MTNSEFNAPAINTEITKIKQTLRPNSLSPMFPTTLQYIETLSNSDGLFKTLKGVSIVESEFGEPYSSGNFGVVFKIMTSQGTKALKCFTRAQLGRFDAYRRISEALPPSPYIIKYNYLETEALVFDDSSGSCYYPVLLMDWVEGDTLEIEVERAVAKNDIERVVELGRKFCDLSAWLLLQPFAHNDLKPCNIMIRASDDQMVLIDYDGMFVESMAGELAREFGTAPFQSPNRATQPFDRHIDDYSIAYLRLAMEILRRDPGRFCEASLVDMTAAELATLETNISIFGAESQFLGTSSHGIMIFKESGRYGFVHTKGNLITDAIFDRAQDFTQDGLAAVSAGGRWGFIDRHGEVVIPMIYESCSDFSQGVAAVKMRQKWGYIDSQGQIITRFKYDNAWSPTHGLALVTLGGVYGFLSLQGSVAIKLRYDFAQRFSDHGLACVRLGGKYGYIDTGGQWAIKPIYDYAQNFRNGRAAVEQQGREFYLSYDEICR